MQELFDAARAYLAGSVGLTWLHGYIGQCESSPAVQSDEIARVAMLEWRQRLSSAWNEWGMNPNPLPEAEFKRWLREQLSGATDSR
ncbi:hypothetical protein LVB77_19190 [Lysobacter sp. 5GHs7-4]|uniref:hypothetical protein n=1 Tax=Lysobacter sp. 5GHs7-4 TaxID=2904253 RepID=UPI001E632A5A|nr:hypothetical protein [Lysobacter sp. 5GHs7-4]UHQ22747.1 hypothetical protein LVB77_19190 [Lysobacter sp. 5GHs7-4]